MKHRPVSCSLSKRNIIGRYRMAVWLGQKPHYLAYPKNEYTLWSVGTTLQLLEIDNIRKSFMILSLRFLIARVENDPTLCALKRIVYRKTVEKRFIKKWLLESFIDMLLTEEVSRKRRRNYKHCWRLYWQSADICLCYALKY